MSHSEAFMARVAQIAELIDPDAVEAIVDEIVKAKRVYVIGLGGSAANASHFVNDLQKLCNKPAQCPTDNVAEFTAWANDEGWDSVFMMEWRKGDLLFVFSVGGGTGEVSTPITEAVTDAHHHGIPICGVVGPVGGHTALYSKQVIRVPEEKNPTPYTEAFQMVVSHCIVSHPKLQKAKTKW